jgi:hypothetical protein
MKGGVKSFKNVGYFDSIKSNYCIKYHKMST